jgi:hypothetical protein
MDAKPRNPLEVQQFLAILAVVSVTTVAHVAPRHDEVIAVHRDNSSGVVIFLPAMGSNFVLPAGRARWPSDTSPTLLRQPNINITVVGNFCKNDAEFFTK